MARFYNISFSIFFLVVVIYFVNSEFLAPMQPRRAQLQYASICCSEEENKLKLHLQTRKFNRTHTAMNMTIDLDRPFDHSYILDAELQSWGDGGWKRNFVKVRQTDACNKMYLIGGETWAKVIDAGNINRGCPVLAGKYNFTNYYVDLSHAPLLSIEGKFQLFLNILRNGIKQTCVLLAVTIEKEIV